MYSIEEKFFGLLLTFSGTVSASELKRWFEESNRVIPCGSSFGVMIDMRTLKPLLPDAQEVMKQGQMLYKERGMNRSAVILDTQLIVMQFRRIAMQSGIDEWERYISAVAHSDWEQIAIDWIVNGVEPVE